MQVVDEGAKAAGKPKFIALNRAQSYWGEIDLESLIEADHPARAIWALTGRLELGRFEGGIRSREGTLRNKWEQARALVEELEKQSEKESGENEEKRRTAARRRAAQARLQRMESSLEELKIRQESVAPSKRNQLRVSDSEPEARKMLQTDGGFAPSYNVQITTEAKSKMVVGIEVVNEGTDTHQLVPALDRVREHYGAQPERIVADGGYATRENVETTESRQGQLWAPWKDDTSREAGARKTDELDPAVAPSR